MRKIFIADSYGSNQLAHLLTELFGDTVEIFCDPNYVPVYRSLNKSRAEIGKDVQRTEKQAGVFANQTSKDNFDVFFLSAKIILEGNLSPKRLKEIYGKANSKVIAISSVSDYLDEAVTSFGADYGLPKSKIMYAKSAAELKDTDKDLIKSFLEESFFKRIHPTEGSKLMEMISFESQKIEKSFRDQKDVDFSKLDRYLTELKEIRCLNSEK